MDTWRTWQLILGELERAHDVLAPTLPGHAGGPPLKGGLSRSGLVDALESMMDDAGVQSAHIAGNSLGGFLALALAARGRARSVVAFAPAGGWAAGDESLERTLALQRSMHEELRSIAPHASALLASSTGRRRATATITENFEHIPPQLLEHLMLGVAVCDVEPFIELAHREGFALDAQAIDCPVRIVWGTADRLLPWPSCAIRYREQLLPHADWVELDGVGHCPQLDVPAVAAHLITGFTGARAEPAVR